jgi:hypothetical protein
MDQIYRVRIRRHAPGRGAASTASIGCISCAVAPIMDGSHISVSRTQEEISLMSELEICMRQLDEVANLPGKVRAEAKLVARQCWNGLSEEDRALVREHLAAELIKLQSKGGVNKIVPDTQLREHGRRLAVLEEAPVSAGRLAKLY